MAINFFAICSRMKYITRWSLMRNTRAETLAEHSLEVAQIAHALGLIRNRRFGGNVDAGRLCALALYHDAPEIITGDMPTPVKNYSRALHSAYRDAEHDAAQRLLVQLPNDLRDDYEPLLEKRAEDAELWKLVKAADKLSALVKCIEERKAGNNEFEVALASTRDAIRAMQLPEADVFLNECIPGYELTLDELDF